MPKAKKTNLKKLKKTKASRKRKVRVAPGLLGASKGGKARAKALSPRKRKMIAKKAAQARWRKKVTKKTRGRKNSKKK